MSINIFLFNFVFLNSSIEFFHSSEGDLNFKFTKHTIRLLILFLFSLFFLFFQSLFFSLDLNDLLSLKEFLFNLIFLGDWAFVPNVIFDICKTQSLDWVKREHGIHEVLEVFAVISWLISFGFWMGVPKNFVFISA